MNTTHLEELEELKKESKTELNKLKTEHENELKVTTFSCYLLS
jgi:hypothetical protein